MLVAWPLFSRKNLQRLWSATRSNWVRLCARPSAEWLIIKKTRKGLNKIIELYNQVSWSAYNAYCKQVLLGTQDFGLLYALRQYLECEQFYKKELETVKDMLAEYNAYLDKGHFLEQFLWGQERESWHCWDHRGVGPYGN